jgi:hypothetical protein
MIEPQRYPCFTCGGSFCFGPHIYEGHHIDAYKINVYSVCWNGNWDGWVPRYERKILAHLAENGLPVPARNAAGYLPRSP